MESTSLNTSGAKRLTVLLALALTLTAHVAQAGTREELQALREEVAGLRQGQEQLQADLDEIKKP